MKPLKPIIVTLILFYDTSKAKQIILRSAWQSWGPAHWWADRCDEHATYDNGKALGRCKVTEVSKFTWIICVELRKYSQRSKKTYMHQFLGVGHAICCTGLEPSSVRGTQTPILVQFWISAEGMV